MSTLRDWAAPVHRDLRPPFGWCSCSFWCLFTLSTFRGAKTISAPALSRLKVAVPPSTNATSSLHALLRVYGVYLYTFLFKLKHNTGYANQVSMFVFQLWTQNRDPQLVWKLLSSSSEGTLFIWLSASGMRSHSKAADWNARNTWNKHTNKWTLKTQPTHC